MMLTINFNCIKQAELALIFQRTERTIHRWHYYGLPRHGEGPGCYYVWTEVLPWYVRFNRTCDTGDTGGDDDTPKFTKSPTYGPNYFRALELLESLQKALTGGVKEDLPRPRTRKPPRKKKVLKPKMARANLW